MIKEAIVKIVDKQDLTYDEAYTVITEIMSGETTPTQNAAFLAALSTKSTKAETIEEITGCAAAMRDKATKLVHKLDVMEIVVELSPNVALDEVAHVEDIRKKLSADMTSALSVSAKITLVSPGMITRSEGKAKRITDNRKLK